MDWAEIGTQVLIAVIGLVISGLGALITYLINKYVKDNKLKTMLLSLNEVVKNVVNEVNQTYVDAIKKGDCFTLECQKEAMNMALEKVKTDLPVDVMNWVKANHYDIDAYLKGLIESFVYSLKQSNKIGG